MEKQEKEKVYNIKIPVYTSELVEQGADLFGGVTRKHMITFVEKKINAYNQQSQKVQSDKRNKTFQKNIDKVEFSNHNIGDIPTILLKISAYNTNLFDGYYETDTRKQFGKNDKIGSDNNYILMYPHIMGLNSSYYQFQWIILIYEDPNKENEDIVRTAKLVLEKIIGIKTANIKLKSVLDELSKIKIIPELQVKLTSISYDRNDVDAKYADYWTSSKLKKDKEDKFNNMPFDNAKDLIDDKSYLEDGFQSKITRLFVGKKEFKITESYAQEVSEKLKQTAEEIYNATSQISQNDLENNLYLPTFIIEKLKPIIDNYLSGTH
ncbi:MAG: hypothetical protein ACK4R6_04385 [Spirosomataceae bacterium]